MDESIKRRYTEAGAANRKALDYAKGYIKEGKSLLDIAETLEKKIDEFSEGKARPAWPVNLSINENAAHQTASLDEEIVLQGTEMVKADIGVHIEGYISDAAVTIDLSGENGSMIEAAEDALEKGIEALENTRDLGEIGEAVEEAAKAKGLNPVRNLTGHFLEQWINHAPPAVPNTKTNYSMEAENDTVIAIEPFVTNGEGYVKEGGKAEIFLLEARKPVRNTNARKILDFIEENYKSLPFAERWIAKGLKMAEFQRKAAFRELVRSGCLKSFPVLHEKKGFLVAQAETSLIIEETGITRLV
jgi:methionyl aminopeptidase